jgi:hypothetical protein
MNRRLLLPLFLLIAATAGLYLWHSSRGHAIVIIDNVTRPVEHSIKSPLKPFCNGAVYVQVDGYLNGDATLQIISNHGRDSRTELISGQLLKKRFGGPEEWADDLLVRYLPGTATTGHIALTLACGRNIGNDN